LAVLVVRAGEVVPADTLVDAVWPERPPATAIGILQNYISQLRKAIEPGVSSGATPRMLVTAEPGYRLVIPSQDLDAWRFERLLAEGRAAVRDGRAAAAVELLAEGLALWRGPALADVADAEPVRHEAQRLDALRVSAVEARLEADVALGRHHELVAELEGLVAVYPLRERLWALLMVCLYRAGRQADALAAFQRLRRRLADELGLDPSSELAQLERDILRHAPALDWSASGPPVTRRQPTAASRVASGEPPRLFVGTEGVDARPHGRVTFLFTDVEGSTRLRGESPEAMRLALGAYDRLLRTVIEEHGGDVFSTVGDACSAAFWTAGDAVAASVEAQRRLSAGPWPEPAEVRVRMGIHTGTADERDGDYLGPAVNRAAHLMAAAHGGQIVVSQAVEELLRDRAPEDITFVDLGEHELAGLARRERLFQVCGPGLALEFPPLRTPAHLAGNLPAAATSFVGHGEELRRLAADAPLRRLITLTGVGGVGKTRLALEAGGMVADEFPGGVWLCELAPVAEPAAVAHAVATILSIRPQVGLSLVDSVIDALRGRRLLLILDNCEHLLDAAAELVGGISETCPTVTVLATSREPLGVAGERVWAVPSLSAATEGVRLFCDRAEAADAAFSPSEGDRAVIAELCERLDGIPLAIELAAARVRFMTVADLAERLDDRFRLLRGGRRGLERHHTLAATVQWSYRLLPEAERVLFGRLSVFAGGFTLSAAEAICADEPLARLDVAGDLAALVDKSMVVADRAGSRARYRLLETLRQFGEERLDETAQAGELRDGHLRYYLGVAREGRRHYEGRAHAAGADALRSEWANFRAAVQWAITQEEQAAATDLLDAVYFFAYLEERYELEDWASQTVAARLATPTAYGIAAVFAAVRGDYDHALSLTETGLATAQSPTEPDTWACWAAAAGAHWYLGRREEGWAASKAAVQTIDPARYPFRASVTAAFGAVMAVTGADPDSAEELLARTQRLAAPLQNPALDAVVAYATGAVARSAGHYESAADHYVRALALAERSGNLLMQGILPMSQAFLAVTTDAHDAERSLLHAVRQLYESRDWQDTWPSVEALALYWMKIGHLEHATVLLGHLQAHGISHAVFIEQRRQTQEALADTPDAHRWMSRGARLDRDELLQFVLTNHGARSSHQDNNET
ncbi:MAG: cyclase, partial [Ilumatobacteraceae bacterium]|nr:cyclase [Ilumatobacteraceae bacterium]